MPISASKRFEHWESKSRTVSTRTGPHAILGEGKIWRERFRQDPTPVPEDRTVGFQIDRFLDFQVSRYRANQISVSDCDQTRQYLEAFRSWMGAESLIDAIHVNKWEAWFVHLLGCKMSLDTRRKRFRRSRDFVAWLGERGLIQVPGNLLSRRFRFKTEPRAIRTMTTIEVKTIIGAAQGQLRLHLLLMLNCGFTQQDIADLTLAEVDWEGGHIIRKWSKTGDLDNVPTVEYPLWSETFRLLKQYRAASGDRALTTQSGLPWVRDGLDDVGKRHRVDAIKSNYAHIAKRLNFNKPMSLLRKTSASKLEEHPDFAVCPTFPGHCADFDRPETLHRPQPRSIRLGGALVGGTVRFLTASNLRSV